MAALQSSQREFEHLGWIGGFEPLIHRLRDMSLSAFLREILQQIAPGQNPHKTALLKNREVKLKAGEDVFDRLLQ